MCRYIDIHDYYTLQYYVYLLGQVYPLRNISVAIMNYIVGMNNPSLPSERVMLQMEVQYGHDYPQFLVPVFIENFVLYSKFTFYISGSLSSFSTMATHQRKKYINLDRHRSSGVARGCRGCGLHQVTPPEEVTHLSTSRTFWIRK